MEEFKCLVESLLITSVEELMLQTGLEKYEVLKLAKKCGYQINNKGYLYANNAKK